MRRGWPGLARSAPSCYNERMNMPFAARRTVALKLTKIGNSTGIILPKEMLTRLGVGVGDSLTVTDTPEGVRLTVADDGFNEQMQAAREVMARRKKALRELAK